MKKSIFKTAAAVLVALGIQTGGQDVAAQNIQREQPDTFKDKKVLVAYYSLSGNTKAIAQQIQDITRGDIFEIEPVTPYPNDYHATTDQAQKEIRAGYKPPLKNKVENITDYDVIFVGSPCWWSTIAPPVTTFLSETDLSGKTVIPFSTHGGSGLARNASDTAKLTPNSKVLDGKAFWGSRVKESKADVESWLKDLKI